MSEELVDTVDDTYHPVEESTAADDVEIRMEGNGLALEVVGDVLLAGYRIPGDLRERVNRVVFGLMLLAIVALSVALAFALT